MKNGCMSGTTRVTRGHKGKRPQSRRLTASLFIHAHEIMKGKKRQITGCFPDIKKSNPGNSLVEWNDKKEGKPHVEPG
eukprot:47075-Pelagomonas_calceolata.AAC.5